MQYWWWRTNASWPHPIKCNSTDILHHSTQASFSLRDIRYKGITNFPWCTCTVEATQCVLLFSNTLSTNCCPGTHTYIHVERKWKNNPGLGCHTLKENHLDALASLLEIIITRKRGPSTLATTSWSSGSGFFLISWVATQTISHFLVVIKGIFHKACMLAALETPQLEPANLVGNSGCQLHLYTECVNPDSC